MTLRGCDVWYCHINRAAEGDVELRSDALQIAVQHCCFGQIVVYPGYVCLS